MPVNQKTLARAPPTQGDASEWTRFKRLSAEASVVPARYNPQKVFRFPFPQIQKIWQGITNPSTGPVIPPGVSSGALARTQYVTTSGGDPTLEDPESWGTANPSAATLDSFQPGDDGVFIPQANVTGDADYEYAVIHFTGQFRAPATGTYAFQVTSDDGVQLEINGTRIIDSRSAPGDMLTETFSSVSDSISLNEGQQYPVNMLWANGSGGIELEFGQITINGSVQGGSIFDCFYS